MNTNLSGKLALVTGAETGLGANIALRLAQDGADVIVHYVFNRENAQEIARRIQKMGRQAYLVQADFCSAEETRAMFREIEGISPVDILVNNAGALFQRATFLDLCKESDQLWEKSFQVNYMGVVRTMRELVPGMCQRGWGRVVNISSVSCRIRALPGATIHYSPMKSAVETLTIHVSAEVAQFGVTCNCVGPGNMVTPLTQNAPLPNPHVLELYHAKRNAAPDEVASAVEYLVSPDAGFITGEVYYVSGGR